MDSCSSFCEGKKSCGEGIGFLRCKKTQQKQGAEERGMNSSVEQNGDQLPMMAHAQTKATARFQEAFNGTSAESDSVDLIAELVKSSD